MGKRGPGPQDPLVGLWWLVPHCPFLNPQQGIPPLLMQLLRFAIQTLLQELLSVSVWWLLSIVGSGYPWMPQCHNNHAHQSQARLFVFIWTTEPVFSIVVSFVSAQKSKTLELEIFWGYPIFGCFSFLSQEGHSQGVLISNIGALDTKIIQNAYTFTTALSSSTSPSKENLTCLFLSSLLFDLLKISPVSWTVQSEQNEDVKTFQNGHCVECRVWSRLGCHNVF